VNVEMGAEAGRKGAVALKEGVGRDELRGMQRRRLRLTPLYEVPVLPDRLPQQK